MATQKNWYQLSPEETRDFFHTDFHTGLSTADVPSRQEQYGKNTLEEGDRKGIFELLLQQFKSPLVFILLIAGVITLFLQLYLDTVVIFISLLINVVIGFIQEERASNAFQKLKKIQKKTARVIRDGKQMTVPSDELVPGDIIMIQAGTSVPADARLVDENELTVNESALTGEWIDVSKEVETISEKSPVTDRKNMLWMGTLVTGGRGKAIVVKTGTSTQLGRIAESLTDELTQETPLQKNIKKLAHYLTYAIFAALVIIFTLGIIRGEPAGEMFLVAIAIAVAAMPEGLPAAVTVVLAIGMESLLNKKGLIRNLLAAETLGSTTVVLTDKTGTITKASMDVASVATFESLGNPQKHEKHEIGELGSGDESDVLAMGVLAADAFVEGYDDALSEWVVRGNPVERAILSAGLRAGISKDKMLEANPELDTIPFESERRFSATLHSGQDSKSQRVYFISAPEILLDNAEYYYHEGKKKKITEDIQDTFRDFQAEKSREGLLLVAIGYRDIEQTSFSKEDRDGSSNLFEETVFCGFIVAHDPIREDVPASIRNVQGAGARVIMITGDNKHTAKRIAEKVGISRGDEKVITGTDVEGFSDEELLNALQTSHVFARILPHQKMRLVSVLQAHNEVVAMTGDGVNDAPALQRANIGIALGSGTEVAKEASDMILLNNSFTIIERAIGEGRRILDNLKKIVSYLLSTSFSEVFVIGGALIAGAPLPLLPTQILWTNIVEEGFMNFAFAFEPQESDVMKRDPRAHRMKNIVTKELKSLILILSLVTGFFLVAIYFFLLSQELPIEEVRTLMFIILSIDSIFFTFSLKDLSQPIWKINFFSNRYLVFAFLASIGALVSAITVPFLKTLLSVTTITLTEFGLIILVGLANLAAIEIVKYVYFERKKK